MERVPTAPSPFTVVDLFCGAGGMSLGFRRAGFRSVRAIDSWTSAVETYRTNLGTEIEEGAIDDDTVLPDADVIVGGPPCQGFSSAGARRKGDHRNTLVNVFARLIARARPRAFVFENVEGFITHDDGRFILDLLGPLISSGYWVHVRKVNAANYGVPQHRKRVLAIGGLGWAPAFPPPTHSAWGAPGAVAFGGLPPTPSLAEALAGLPPPVCSRRDPDGSGHNYLPLSDSDLARARVLGPGQRMRDLPEHMWHESYRRRAYRRVMDGLPTEKRGGAPAGLRRLRADEPSKAVTGGAQGEFLHPTEDRPLTVRECARLQTFPDDFRFVARKASDCLQLVGNAVPVRLAERVARSLMDDLRLCRTESRSPAAAGRLLSFQPTASTGQSPALNRVCRMIRERYEEEPARGLFADAAI